MKLNPEEFFQLQSNLGEQPSTLYNTISQLGLSVFGASLYLAIDGLWRAGFKAAERNTNTLGGAIGSMNSVTYGQFTASEQIVGPDGKLYFHAIGNADNTVGSLYLPLVDAEEEPDLVEKRGQILAILTARFIVSKLESGK